MKTIKLLVLFGICSVGLLTHVSCKSRDNEICDTAKSLFSNVMREVSEMQNSITPWGAKEEIPDIRREWGRVKSHMLGCEQCQHALKTKGTSVIGIDLEMNQVINQWSIQCDQGTNRVAEDFLRGFIQGLCE